MTAAAAAPMAPSADATVTTTSNAPQLPIHNAPSLQDLLELKRQKRSLDEGPRPEPGPTLPAQPCSDEVAAVVPTGDNSFLSAANFTAPVLPCVPGEPMSSYFPRLRDVLASNTASPGPQQPESRPVTSLDPDGIYLLKRPIRAPNGASPLAVCGSVLHHVVVLVKEGPRVFTLDFGPANGADVTANILEQAAPKKVLSVGDTSAAGPDGAALDKQMPYLYLGPATCGVNHPLVQQLIAFAESRPYHALGNNCIHFADALVRVMTAGAVRGAPLLYDIKCGAVPPVDNPMLMMMQLMLRMPWFVVVDGSPLTSAFLEHYNAAGKQPSQPQQSSDPGVAAEDGADAAEEAGNNAAPAVGGTEPSATTTATGTHVVEAAAAPVAAGAAGSSNISSSSAPTTSSASRGGCGEALPGAESDGRAAGAASIEGSAVPERPSSNLEPAGQAEEERTQEQHNDHALCDAAAQAEVQAEAVASKA